MMDKMDEDVKPEVKPEVKVEVKTEARPEGKKKAKSQVKDRIAAEYDVFLSQNLTNQLNLFQFPLRPVWHPIGKDSVAGVRMKAKHHKFELDLELDTNPEHYVDRFQGLRQLQHSSQQMPLQTNLAVAVVRDGEVHLTPLRNVSRFKPSLSHLKKDGAAEDLMAVEETSVMPADSQHEQQFRPKQLAVKRREAPRRAPSQAALRREEEEEPWTELEYHDLSDNVDNHAFSQLFAANRYEIPFDLAPRDYLQELVAPSAAAAVPGRPVEVAEVIRTDGGVEAVLQDLFARHPLLSLGTISAVLQKAAQGGLEPLSEDGLQAWLGQHCLPLNGGWVLRQSGDESLAKDREAILRVFQNTKQAKRSDFNTMARQLHGQQVGTSAYKKIVPDLATFNGSAWVLKDPA